MVKQFEILIDWYKPDNKGKQKLVKKNIKLNREFDINDILLAEYLDNNGKIIKKYSLIIDKEKGDQYKLNMPYKKAIGYINQRVDQRHKIKGFAAYTDIDDTQDI